MFTSIFSPRPALATAVLAISSLTFLAVPQGAQAQTSVNIQRPRAIGLTHAQTKPYNFTGRTVDFDFGFVGSGTLIRRHTVATAAHVVYLAGTGFTSGLTFTRGLYGEFFTSRQQVSAVGVLSGYQTAADDAALTAGAGIETLDTGARDTGYMVINDPPVDDDWGNYFPEPSALTDNSGRFLIGYPAETFNGRTMAVVVPQTPFVQLGDIDSQYYVNEEFTSEGGNSGGPIYSVQNSQQVIVATYVAGADVSSVEGLSFVRAIDDEADALFTGVEYSTGLINGVRFKGPKTVERGTTVTYKLSPTFANRSTFDGLASTTRYKELALSSDFAGTLTQPTVTIVKVNNKKFRVTFSSRLRSGTVVTLTAGYAIPVTKTGTLAPGTTADNITNIQTTITDASGVDTQVPAAYQVKIR